VGPTCEVLLENDDGATLDTIDSVLATLAERIERTRKGRVWDVWVRGRLVSVEVQSSPPQIGLGTGCKSDEDYAVLRELAGALASALGGIATEPIK
jgi:hypothetical protein